MRIMCACVVLYLLTKVIYLILRVRDIYFRIVFSFFKYYAYIMRTQYSTSNFYIVGVGYVVFIG